METVTLEIKVAAPTVEQVHAYLKANGWSPTKERDAWWNPKQPMYSAPLPYPHDDAMRKIAMAMDMVNIKRTPVQVYKEIMGLSDGAGLLWCPDIGGK